MIKSLICIILMLTVSPIVTVIGLISFEPNNFGDRLTIQNILVMAGFGLITVPLWITYIPALVLAPFAMKKLARKQYFHDLPIWKFISISFIVGAVVGIIILLPLMASKNFLTWARAGAISGAITFTLIAVVYRLGNNRSELQNRN